MLFDDALRVPPVDRFRAPCLRLHADGEVHLLPDFVREVADELKLTPEDRAHALASGRGRAANLVHWAAVYLRQAGLVESVGSSRNRITDRGRAFLAETGGQFGLAELDRFPEFRDLKLRRRTRSDDSLPAEETDPEPATPEEQIAQAWETLNAALQQELLEEVKRLPPPTFERLVVRLLLKMGYGSADERAGQVTPFSGDEGIDGVISEDKLGLDKITIQAKRHTVGRLGRPEVQAFVGALVGTGATKGVFLTTAEFSDEARRYVQGLKDQKVALVDGNALARLMVEHNLGVAVERTLEIKRLDRDFLDDGRF